MHLSSNEANIDKISLFISHIHRKWMREQERKAETVARSYGILLESNERCVRNTENGERARARKKKSSSREHYHFYNVLIYVDAQKKKKKQYCGRYEMRSVHTIDAPQMEIYSKINFHKIVNEEILIRCANTIRARVR